MKKFNCKTTIFACFTGYVLQAVDSMYNLWYN